MDKNIINHENKEFKQIDYNEKKLRDREFFQCRFIACSFIKSDLKGNHFEDCTFENCNFSMTEIKGVSLRDCKFKGCKLLGIDFTQCNKFAFSLAFDHCILDYSSFYQTKLKNTNFLNCLLKEVDFSESDLTAAIFRNSDLMGAVFSSSILEKADFREAQNISINPEENKLKKAKFSTYQLEGLLHKYGLEIY